MSIYKNMKTNGIIPRSVVYRVQGPLPKTTQDSISTKETEKHLKQRSIILHERDRTSRELNLRSLDQ